MLLICVQALFSIVLRSGVLSPQPKYFMKNKFLQRAYVNNMDIFGNFTLIIGKK
jgi:hypothetical protein